MNPKKLFPEDFGEIYSDEAFAELCGKFPNYDSGYLCQATYGLRKKTKAWMENLWQQYMIYADSHFLEDFRRQFAQRSWELYLGATFINRGFVLNSHNQEGPDFDVCDKDKKRIFWVEAIAVKKGDGIDRVPETVYNSVGTIPTDEIILRLASGLQIKFKKYLLDRAKGIISDTDPYIIAIDRSELEHLDAMLPNILKAVFGIGELALRMRIGEEPTKDPENFWTHKPTIKKQSGQSVSMHFFDIPEHAGISAVIYNKDSIINSPRDPQEMGEGFFIVHNPLAKNPLQPGFLPFGEEYAVEGGFIKKIRGSKNFKKPNPFEYLDD